MPHSLFHIPKTMIKRSIYSPRRKFNWEEYDKCCKRSCIKIPFNIIKNIYNLTNLSYPIKNKNSTYHYIKYTINMLSKKEVYHPDTKLRNVSVTRYGLL